MGNNWTSRKCGLGSCVFLTWHLNGQITCWHTGGWSKGIHTFSSWLPPTFILVDWLSHRKILQTHIGTAMWFPGSDLNVVESIWSPSTVSLVTVNISTVWLVNILIEDADTYCTEDACEESFLIAIYCFSSTHCKWDEMRLSFIVLSGCHSSSSYMRWGYIVTKSGCHGSSSYMKWGYCYKVCWLLWQQLQLLHEMRHAASSGFLTAPNPITAILAARAAGKGTAFGQQYFSRQLCNLVCHNLIGWRCNISWRECM